MKKRIIILGVSLLVLVIGFISFRKYQKYLEKERIKNAIIKIEFIEPLEVAFNSQIKVSDLIKSINGKLVDDFNIDTAIVGEKIIDFEYINEEDIKVPYQFKVKIVDKIPPVIWLNDVYTITEGYQKDLVSSIMCGDNYDDRPKCFIEGEYDVKKRGSYPLKYYAIDSSGNQIVKDFTLKVIKKTSSRSNSSTIPFRSLYNEYKKNNTKVGIDVSKWQGDIDFQKVKEEGVEFAFLKIGGRNGIDGEYYLDPKFERNYEGFKNVDIPVGLYFYSYAKNILDAKNDALWVINQIKDKEINLPIAFDWENWSKYNDFHVSFHHLTESAKIFVKTLEAHGYQGMLYSSKNYLEKIWQDNDLNIWLAHYINQTNYQGKYQCWQRTSSAKISGITVNTVDVDICYVN